MNAETIKAMNKQTKKVNRFIDWYHKNAYKIYRVIFFPIWLAYEAKTKIRRYLNAQTVWSEERANEILSYYIPRKATWDAENNEFYFFDNGLGWGMKHTLRKIKLKDRRFWKKFSGFWGGDIRKYLIEKFELEGFIKELGYTDNSETEITFTLKERN